MAHGVLLVIQGCATLAMVSAWSASDAVIKLWPLESGNYEQRPGMSSKDIKRFWQARAHTIVSRAVSLGALPDPKKLRCFYCLGKAVEYDHRDYLDAMNVAAVCHSCNCKRGPGWFPSWTDTLTRWEAYPAVSGFIYPNSYYAQITSFKARHRAHFPLTDADRLVPVSL